jgi:hypothetical protein
MHSAIRITKCDSQIQISGQLCNPVAPRLSARQITNRLASCFNHVPMELEISEIQIFETNGSVRLTEINLWKYPTKTFI